MPVLLVLALTVFAGALSMRIIDPVVPEVARDLHTTASTVALLASAFAFPYALGQPLLGPLGDALGKARIIKIFLAVLALALFFAALAPSIELLFIARIISGIAAGGIVPVALAMVGDRFSITERHVAISRINLAAVSGQLTSAIGAGLLASIFGWRIVLMLAGAAAIATLIASMISLAPRPKSENRSFTFAGFKSGYVTIFANPKAIVCYAAVFIEGLAVYGQLPYVATLLEARGLGGIREAGIVIAGIGCGGAIYSVFVQLALKRLGGMFNVMRSGGFVAALGFCIVAFQPVWPVQFLAFIFIGMGFFMVHNVLQVQATELAPAARGASIALHAFFFFLGQAFGPLLYGLGLATVGIAGSVLVSAAAMIALGLIAPRAFEWLGARS